MIRFLLSAVVFGSIGAGSTFVDWKDVGNTTSEWWNSKTMKVYKFCYWRQCSNCFNLMSQIDVRSCCDSCGNTNIIPNVRARLIERDRLESARGYQTADGKVFINKSRYGDFAKKFTLDNDVYELDGPYVWIAQARNIKPE